MKKKETRSTVSIEVTRIALGGEGVGHKDGKVVFIEGGLPGELVEVQIFKEKKRFAKGRVRQVLRAAAERRERDCEHEKQGCGGCGLRHVRDEFSLQVKTGAAMGELRKLAPSADWPEPSLHLEEKMDGTRRRVHFHVSKEKLGLYKKGSHDLIRIPSCKAMTPELLNAAYRLEEVLRGVKGIDAKGLLIEHRGDNCYLFWEGFCSQRQRKAMVPLLEEGVIAGIRFDTSARKDPTIVDIGEEWIQSEVVVAGRTFLYERPLGSFGQANTSANQKLISALHAGLVAAEPECIVDLYAGSGNLSLVAASVAPKAVAVEFALDGIRGMKRNFGPNAPLKVEVVSRDLRKGLGKDLLPLAGDVVVLDPPRSGAKEIIEDLLKASPRHLFYVSCSPTHMARDIEALSGSYEVKDLNVFDMFPRTTHLEMLVHLERRVEASEEVPEVSTEASAEASTEA